MVLPPYFKKLRFIVDDLVMVNVRQIAEMGAYVQLLEYDNIEGMILLSELSRRRIRSIQKLIRVGKNEVVVVLRVDKEKGECTYKKYAYCTLLSSFPHPYLPSSSLGGTPASFPFVRTLQGIHWAKER